jgi:hypothetical protein
MPVTEHMDMGWQVVIHEDDEAHAMGAVNCNHGCA